MVKRPRANGGTPHLVHGGCPLMMALDSAVGLLLPLATRVTVRRGGTFRALTFCLNITKACVAAGLPNNFMVRVYPAKDGQYEQWRPESMAVTLTTHDVTRDQVAMRELHPDVDQTIADIRVTAAQLEEACAAAEAAGDKPPVVAFVHPYDSDHMLTGRLLVKRSREQKTRVPAP